MCVVVATFNNPRTISSVVKDIVKTTQFPVLIVDDGSETPVTNVLYSYEVREALEEGRVRVVRFTENRGKGAALRFAVQDLIARGFTHMISIDGDGQHQASEIPKLIELSKNHPWDLIIGNRGGRKFSSLWVAYQTGLRVQDPRSGFRLYPLFPLQTMRFNTVKFDFETEVLIRLIWRGVQVRETEIKSLQQEVLERVSHFHRIRDNARITFLNISLAFISLLRLRLDPINFSWALGLGVFIGCTPFFGLHTLIVAAVALVLRLNVVATFIGSLISLPTMVPSLVLGSVSIGKNILRIPESTGIFVSFNQWMAGSFVLGAGLGLVIGLIAYGAIELTRRKIGYIKLKTPYFWLFSPSVRGGLNEYYRILKPGWTWWVRQKAVMGHLFKFGQILVDRLNPGHRGPPPGRRAMGTGLILLGAHIGKVNEKMCPNYLKTANDQQGESTTFDIHQALKRGECVGLMGDRPIGDRFELIPFLGMLAPFDVTVYRLAVALQVPLQFTFELKGDKGYDIFVRPPRVYNFDMDLSSEEQLYEWASEYVRELEGLVKKYPDQWFNFFPFWSALPVTPASNHLLQELNEPPSPSRRELASTQTGAPQLHN